MFQSIYLARPIDRVQATQLDDFTATVATLFADRGVAVYRPENAFNLPEDANSPFVLQANMAVLSQADVLVVLMPNPDAKTWGVPQEIAYAIGAGIPVVLATNHVEKLSWSQQYPNEAVLTVNIQIDGTSTWTETEFADWLFNNVRTYHANFNRGRTND